MIIRIKSTGKEVEVYKSKERGTYINSKDCTTEYELKDIILISK